MFTVCPLELNISLMSNEAFQDKQVRAIFNTNKKPVLILA
jgi:hypothetical protein